MTQGPVSRHYKHRPSTHCIHDIIQYYIVHIPNLPPISHFSNIPILYKTILRLALFRAT